MSQSVSDISANEAVAAEVWACLGRRRLSAQKAAAALGWQQGYISRRLRGSVPFTVPELYALADLLKVPVTEFFPVEAVSEFSSKLDGRRSEGVNIGPKCRIMALAS